MKITKKILKRKNLENREYRKKDWEILNRLCLSIRGRGIRVLKRRRNRYW